ncbi:MAG: YdcF family protein [Oscillospiraceae bacterium]|nr:YdcF family protein [Oscillospiraceae bacterium]MBQ3049568.1 YdcF family protein [Oscillospiraceae bacterium]
MDSMKKFLITILIIALSLIAAVVIGVFAINAYICLTVNEDILSPSDAAALEDVDCIIVLGCFVDENGVPSPLLADRLQRGVELYSHGASPKLLMSGDHGRADYNEVGAMKKYATDRKVPSEDVFMDHAGFSTYESIFRAKSIFCAEKIVIVTQQYHLYRALYIAERLGVEAYGVASDYHRYTDAVSRETREVLARVKDFAFCILRPTPTYLGETISLSGSGDVTND